MKGSKPAAGLPSRARDGSRFGGIEPRSGSMGETPHVLRGALIGCGFFAINQLEAWREIEGVAIVALCDRDPARLREMGARFGIAACHTDAAAMLEAETLDFVDIATTPPSHRALVELAASRGIDAICQKPIAPSLADARAMVAAADAAGTRLAVHENFRWQTPVRAVRQVLDAGTIGAPFWGRVSFRSGHDVYAAQPYLATGERFIIEDLGIHVLDVARFLFGDVGAITARTRRVNPAIRGEDVATMLLEHADGLHCVVDCSYATRVARDPFPETLIEVDGAAGSLRLMQDYRLVVTRPDGTSETDVSPACPAWGSRPWHNIQQSVRALQQDWVDARRSGRRPETHGHDNLKTFALVDAAYRSASTGLSIALDEGEPVEAAPSAP